MTQNYHNKRGFTLLEILLYLAMSGIILFAIMSFSLQIIDLNKKNSDMQEIQTGMDFVNNKLALTIQSASSIDEINSIFGNDIGKLSLTVIDATKSPTLIYLQDQSLYLKEGNGSPAKVNSDFVKCTQLKFTQVATPKAPDQVVIDLQCEPVHSDLATLKQNYSLHTSISLRK